MSKNRPNSNILYLCLALLGVILLLAHEGWAVNKTSNVISNSSVISKSANNLTAPSKTLLFSNTSNSTMTPLPLASTVGVGSFNPNYNPPFRSCVTVPSQSQASEAVYTLGAQANKIPLILFGKGSPADTLSVDIGLYNNFDNHMTGQLYIRTDRNHETIPFTVTSSTTECIGHVGPSENAEVSASTLDQVLKNPPFRQCVEGTNHAAYYVGGNPDLTYQHGNITARDRPTDFTITLNSDLSKGSLTGDLGWPFSIPIKDITVDTKCISKVDFQ